MRVMDLEPEQLVAVLRRRRQWKVLAALLALGAILTALAAASVAMYSEDYGPRAPSSALSP